MASSFGRLPREVSFAAAVVRTVSRVRMVEMQWVNYGSTSIVLVGIGVFWRPRKCWEVAEATERGTVAGVVLGFECLN